MWELLGLWFVEYVKVKQVDQSNNEFPHLLIRKFVTLRNSMED